ncbi:MAG: small multi-drug export protein [Oscillospiraceae bacterium]|nr:small multi-drug export protein [Oscillospiraceae bacterium]
MLKHYIRLILLSMVPLIELRGAIPYSQLVDLPIVKSYIISIIANMIPIPIVFLFARHVLNWGKDKPIIGKFFNFCLEKGLGAGDKLTENRKRGAFIALMLFVGIPIPGTGAWSGALGASLIGMRFRDAMIAIFLGVIMAGIIMATASYYGFNLL